MEREDIFAIAPCLKEGSLAVNGLKFVETALKVKRQQF